MNSPKLRVLMAGVILATAASSLGARAADQGTFFEQQRQITDGYYPEYAIKQPSNATVLTAALQSTSTESPQFEWFEHQLSKGSVPSVTPSEKAGGESAPQSASAESSQFEWFEHQLSKE